MLIPKEHVANLHRTGGVEPSRIFKKRLDRCERNIPFSNMIIENIKSRISGELIMTYPDPEPLYISLSKFLGIHRGKILFHSGSDLAIKSIYETYISTGDKLLLHCPGYAMYDVYAKMFGASVESLSYDKNMKFDIDRYIEMISPGIKMAVLENPNGFAGNVYPKNKVESFIARAAANNAIAVIDEAYFFFIEETAASFLEHYDNLIISRTMSKAFGGAGLRCGYLLSNEHNIYNLAKVKPMHELTSLTILVVEEMLNHPDELKRYLQETTLAMKYLKKSLEHLDIRTSESKANFLAAEIGSFVNPIELADFLASHDFLVRRPFREKCLKNWMRIGTSSIDEEKQLINLIKTFMEQHNA